MSIQQIISIPWWILNLFVADKGGVELQPLSNIADDQLLGVTTCTPLRSLQLCLSPLDSAGPSWSFLGRRFRAPKHHSAPGSAE